MVSSRRRPETSSAPSATWIGHTIPDSFMRYGGTRERRDETADPKHPRRFTEELKRQTVELCSGGKPFHEIMAEHGLGRSTLRRWVNSINATGVPLGEGPPVRQRGRRVDEQDAEGRVRLRGELPDVARAAGQAERLRPLARPFQAALEARLRESGRVRECGSQSLKKLSK